MCKKCYVTTPIYYASGTPQLGNSYSTVACDVFARFNRLMKRDTFYLTGMDEHGQKIEEVAAKACSNPQEFVDKIAEGTKAIWKDLNISYDYFIRTTDDNLVRAVQMFFEKLLANGDI
jgi:methionyl-tRNA synthetase